MPYSKKSKSKKNKRRTFKAGASSNNKGNQTIIGNVNEDKDYKCEREVEEIHRLRKLLGDLNKLRLDEMEAAQRSAKMLKKHRNHSNAYRATMKRLTEEGKKRSKNAMNQAISESNHTYVRPSTGTKSKPKSINPNSKDIPNPPVENI